MGTCQSAFLTARLINVYARLGLVFDAQKAFDTTQFQGTSNMLLWNSILRANVSHGFYEKALKLYDKMRRLGVWADGFTLPLVIRACAFKGRFRLCKNVHSHVLQMGFQNHLHVVNELVGMYGKLGQMDYARQLFDKMSVRSYVSWNTLVSSYAFNYDCDGASEIFRRMELNGLEPNPVTWTSLLSSHARCGRNEKTLELYGMMRVRGIETTAEALAVVLSVCADLSVVDKGRKIHGYVIRGGFKDYLCLNNALICMYGKCGDVENAYKLFLGMESKSLVSWNALIDLGAANLKVQKTDCCLEPNQYLHNCPNSEDLRSLFSQAIDVQALQMVPENQIDPEFLTWSSNKSTDFVPEASSMLDSGADVDKLHK